MGFFDNKSASSSNSGFSPKYSPASRPNFPAPKPNISKEPQNKSLPSLSKRGEFGVRDLDWSLRSQKDKIYRKYNISGKEVDEFANNLKKYDLDKRGYLSKYESSKMEKPLKTKSTWSGNTKEGIKSGKWLKILSDPEIFKK
ncbi:MAG: hypothetical protein PHF44_02270 [Candidatus Pacebacteria bacterium]|nr:hypothetical protein [Candidatus Paceibacterota bacterium]